MVTCSGGQELPDTEGCVCWGIVVVQNPGVGRPQLPSLAPNKFCHQPVQYLHCQNAGLLSDRVVHIPDGPCLGGQGR